MTTFLPVADNIWQACPKPFFIWISDLQTWRLTKRHSVLSFDRQAFTRPQELIKQQCDKNQTFYRKPFFTFRTDVIPAALPGNLFSQMPHPMQSDSSSKDMTVRFPPEPDRCFLGNNFDSFVERRTIFPERCNYLQL
jgi:hypothetical protein